MKLSGRTSRASIPLLRSGKEGSSLLIVVLLITVLSAMVASLLRVGSTEMRLNHSHIEYMEAANAAESIVEYGFASLEKRWRSQTNFTESELRDFPLSIPSTAKEFYANTDVVFNDFELIGGNVPTGVWAYIDPNDPNNQEDPQKGKRIFKRDVIVFGKAATTHPWLGKKVVYCSQVLNVRDAPLFTHAIFYNMDLEFHPGPSMVIDGPVHSNADIYLQAVRSLKFLSTLNAQGDIFHLYKQTGAQKQSGTVEVLNSDQKFVGFWDGSDLIDSRLGDPWRAVSTDRWDGNVATGDHEVPELNPISIDDYVPDDPSTVQNEKENHAYALIEPQLADTHASFKGQSVREQQMSYKAGLVFEVTRVANQNTAKGYEYELSAYKYNRKSQLDPKSEPMTTASGGLKKQKIDLSKVEQKVGKTLISSHVYAEDATGTPTSGFYDRRQSTEMDVIELDVGVLAEMVNDGESNGGNSDPWNGQFHLNPGRSIDWNGVVYVELPYENSQSTRSDKVIAAKKNVALRLVNGGEVPNPKFSKASGYDPGFTVATNGQLYVKGSFNADGLAGTGSSTDTDDGKVKDSVEAPVALFADSITILSDAFDDSKSKLSPKNRIAEFTEVSAALVTGLVPTDPGGSAQSGGAHNLPRFLEKWSGVEFRYRGSLVALYESEVGTSPMTSGHGAWYSPPKRNWGYNNLFRNGYYPPGTPLTRDFRRTNFRYLSEQEYNDGITGIPGFDRDKSPRGQSSGGGNGNGSSSSNGNSAGGGNSSNANGKSASANSGGRS